MEKKNCELTRARMCVHIFISEYMDTHNIHTFIRPTNFDCDETKLKLARVRDANEKRRLRHVQTDPTLSFKISVEIALSAMIDCIVFKQNL